jgi:hypothetical protein
VEFAVIAYHCVAETTYEPTIGWRPRNWVAAFSKGVSATEKIFDVTVILCFCISAPVGAL